MDRLPSCGSPCTRDQTATSDFGHLRLRALTAQRLAHAGRPGHPDAEAALPVDLELDPHAFGRVTSRSTESTPSLPLVRRIRASPAAPTGLLLRRTSRSAPQPDALHQYDPDRRGTEGREPETPCFRNRMVGAAREDPHRSDEAAAPFAWKRQSHAEM